MSSNPIALDPSLEPLFREGFEVEIRDNHLLIHNIPFASATKVVRYASLACLCLVADGKVLPPNPASGDNHQVWWTGEYPCYPDGTLLELGGAALDHELLPGLRVAHQFSIKPDGQDGYASHHEKVRHYVNLIERQAKAIDPDVSARTGKVVAQSSAQSVFVYPDTASSRASIVAISAKLIGRIAIVGLGGTGSYVLDQVAKTPVGEIHLFDGDLFNTHNAFRSPGAASIDEINAKEPKTDYYARKYGAQRYWIVSHPQFIDPGNIEQLTGFDFIFICVDKGSIREMLARFLISHEVPFIDVGMNLLRVAETDRLLGSCRATLVTPSRVDHIDDYLPMDDDDDDEGALYRQNIQVADMNAINALLAVMMWKQTLGFYDNPFTPYNVAFSVNHMSTVRAPLRPQSDE